MIAQTLEQTNHNISEAALLLDMSRSTLYRKIKEYQLMKELKFLCFGFS
ncbi:MAG: helix-turn-helix domain-containing protein [Syntrophomonadaceae bacterium]